MRSLLPFFSNLPAGRTRLLLVLIALLILLPTIYWLWTRTHHTEEEEKSEADEWAPVLKALAQRMKKALGDPEALKAEYKVRSSK